MSEEPPEDVAQSCLFPGGTVLDPPPRQLLRQDLLRCLYCGLAGSAVPPYFWSSGNPTIYLIKYCQALLTLGIVSILLREALVKGTIQRPWPWSYPASQATVSIPTTESLDFCSIMDMPLPFAADIATRLPFCHLATMTSKSYVEDGEWVGFYNTSFGSPEVLFDMPMHGIRFQLRNDRLEASGEDGVGGFQLFGQLVLDTGEMSLTKRYNSGQPEWAWSCMMTPFGIAGTWGTSNYGGWLWLWKVKQEA